MTYTPKIDRIEDDGSRTAHTLVETTTLQRLEKQAEIADVAAVALRARCQRLQDVMRKAVKMMETYCGPEAYPIREVLENAIDGEASNANK